MYLTLIINQQAPQGDTYRTLIINQQAPQGAAVLKNYDDSTAYQEHHQDLVPANTRQ